MTFNDFIKFGYLNTTQSSRKWCQSEILLFMPLQQKLFEFYTAMVEVLWARSIILRHILFQLYLRDQT